MYRILVVDDEPRHRIGLVNMIKRLRPDYMASEARNGEEALRIAENNPLDIVITDIKMPVMDGLQFIEGLGDRINEIKVIILSAFGYFEFAQKAVSLGAFDYLLKPIDEVKVIEVLTKVENQIIIEQAVKREKESLRKQLDNTLPVYLELQLNKWVKGSLCETELKEIEGIFPYKGPGLVLASEIANLKAHTENYTRDELNEIIINIKYWMKEALKLQGHSLSFYLNVDKTILITILVAAEKCSLPALTDRTGLDEFINNLKIGYGFETVIGVSSSFESIFDKAEEAFKQAVLALEFSFFVEKENIIAFSEMVYNPKKVIVTKYKEEEDLLEAIRKGNIEKSILLMAGIFNRMTAEGYPTVSQLLNSVNHILISITKNVQNLIDEYKYHELIQRIPELVNKSDSLDRLKTSVNKLISAIIEGIVLYREKKGFVLFEKCLEYIQKHLAEDISLETVAEEFHFNQSYFSYLFKSKTGVNFNQFLNDCRLKMGKELLEKTDKKVYEIANNVGYKDPKYFIRVFKKEFGMTPDEYRRLI